MGHVDVNVPLLLLPEAPDLLGRFAAFLQEEGVPFKRRDKLPGNHLTPFWIYVELDPRCF